MAPSGCNFQPWEAVVLTGEPLKALQAKIHSSKPDSPPEYDFSASRRGAEVPGSPACSRLRMYAAMNISRDDAAKRSEFHAGRQPDLVRRPGGVAVPLPS